MFPLGYVPDSDQASAVAPTPSRRSRSAAGKRAGAGKKSTAGAGAAKKAAPAKKAASKRASKPASK